MAITATVNFPAPSVIQLYLGILRGPLVSAALGGFDPRRDLTIFANGVPVSISSCVFDGVNNRYTITMVNPLPWTVSTLPPLVQIIHHMPSPPFKSSVETNPTLDLLNPGRNPDILGGTT